MLLFYQESASDKYIGLLSISKDYRHQNEGELSLTLRSGDIPLYTIAFSIVPGHVASLRATSVILISRMQGYKSSFEAVRVATKFFRDVSPQAILFSVLQGLANALQIKYIVGIAAREHCSYTPVDDKKIEQIYNEFYLSVGARGPIRGFFYLGPNELLQFASKLPIQNRTRRKAKRKFKLEISKASEENALKNLLWAEDTGGARKTGATAGAGLEPPWIGRAISTLNSLLLAENLAHLEFLISPIHLYSNVGTRVCDKIVATGKEGLLVYGPYLTLRAGRYSVRFAMESNGSIAFKVDVVADRGNRLLGEGDFTPKRTITFADVEFETSTDCHDVEFRVFVSPGSSIQFGGVEVKRLAPQSISNEGL